MARRCRCVFQRRQLTAVDLVEPHYSLRRDDGKSDGRAQSILLNLHNETLYSEVDATLLAVPSSNQVVHTINDTSLGVCASFERASKILRTVQGACYLKPYRT